MDLSDRMHPAIAGFNEVMIEDSLEGIGSGPYREYLAHALCLGGNCAFTFNGRPFILARGDLMIVRKGRLVDNIKPSPDFSVRTLYVTAPFIALCTPQTNYGTRGQLSLFLNPVMRLDAAQRRICQRDFAWIEYRLGQKDHTFYRELLVNAVQAAILDFFDFHSTINRETTVTTQSAALMNRFIDMLESGLYRTPRSHLLCRRPMRNPKIPLGNLKKSKRLSGKLLDKPLYSTRTRPTAARPLTHLRQHRRHVSFFLPRLFQPLRAAQPRPQSVAVQERITCRSTPEQLLWPESCPCRALYALQEPRCR